MYLSVFSVTYATLVTLFFTTPAHAYIDPGAGSMVLQMLAALGVGLIFYVGKIREMITGLFTRRPKKVKEENADAEK